MSCLLLSRLLMSPLVRSSLWRRPDPPGTVPVGLSRASPGPFLGLFWAPPGLLLAAILGLLGPWGSRACSWPLLRSRGRPCSFFLPSSSSGIRPATAAHTGMVLHKRRFGASADTNPTRQNITARATQSACRDRRRPRAPRQKTRSNTTAETTARSTKRQTRTRRRYPAP